MKLTDIETFVVGNPPPHFGGRYFVFVKITTDSGVSGIGEAYCVPFEPHLVAKMIEDVFARYVAGRYRYKRAVVHGLARQATCKLACSPLYR